MTTEKSSNLAEAGASTFDRTKHQPPRIDQFGYNKDFKAKIGHDGSNILSTGEKTIPDWWSKKFNPVKTTRTDLIENRRKETVPHISYDLDGDGYVGNRDFVISKLFDKDGKGKLNDNERKEALDAVKNVSIDLWFPNGHFHFVY